MDFKKFIKAAQNPELRKKALEGFEARQHARNLRFAEEAKKREPSAEWENRRYTI